MVFIINEDLPKKLYPLAWLIGSWKGTGVLRYDADDFKIKPTEIDQFAEFSYNKHNDYLTYNAKTVKKDSDEVLYEESGFWIVDYEINKKDGDGQQSADDSADAKNIHASGPEFQISVLISNAVGYNTVLQGVAGNGRIELASKKTTRLQSPFEFKGSKRLYGYVKDRLLWLEEIQAFDNPLKPFLSVELDKSE